MARKMSRRLVALSSSAVAAVYLTGFLTTEAASRQGAPDTRPASSRASVPAALNRGIALALPTTQPSTGLRPAVPAAPTAAPAGILSGAAGANATYRDGTYTGSGMSRRGGVDVAVTIQKGKITSAAITGGSTQYPLSRIAGLPAQVVARQSAQVDRVTGATYSVQAYVQAVQQALTQARA